MIQTENIQNDETDLHGGPAWLKDSSERYDITDAIVERDFVSGWRDSIRRAFATFGGIANVVRLKGEAAGEKAPLTRDRITGAFNEQGEWIPPSPGMMALKAEPTTVLAVTLATGQRLKVVLTSPDKTWSADHFVVLKGDPTTLEFS